MRAGSSTVGRFVRLPASSSTFHWSRPRDRSSSRARSRPRRRGAPRAQSSISHPGPGLAPRASSEHAGVLPSPTGRRRCRPGAARGGLGSPLPRRPDCPAEADLPPPNGPPPAAARHVIVCGPYPALPVPRSIRRSIGLTFAINLPFAIDPPFGEKLSMTRRHRNAECSAELDRRRDRCRYAPRQVGFRKLASPGSNDRTIKVAPFSGERMPEFCWGSSSQARPLR